MVEDPIPSISKKSTVSRANESTVIDALRKGNASISQLSAITCLSRSTVVDTCSRLMKEGMIRRVQVVDGHSAAFFELLHRVQGIDDQLSEAGPVNPTPTQCVAIFRKKYLEALEIAKAELEREIRDLDEEITSMAGSDDDQG